MPTCRRLVPQNWLLWQSPSTEVHQIFIRMYFFSSTVLTQQSALRSVHPLSNKRSGSLKKRKYSVKHKPAGSITVPAGRANK